MVSGRWGRALALALAFAVVCLFAPFQMAQGMGRMDPAKTNDLTISYSLDGKAVSGVTVNIYEVATASSQDGSSEDLYQLASDFADAGVSVDTNQTDAEWTQSANALAGYVSNKDLKPTASAESDQGGHVSFSGLESGLYLVVSTPQKMDGDTYQILPTLCALPSLDSSGNWSYSTTLVPKFKKTTHSTSYSVVKHWVDTASGASRPASIKVAIIHDGKTQSVQTLDSSNDWCYRWNADDDGSTWTVSEVDVPQGYTVSLSSSSGGNQTAFVLTNKSGNVIPHSQTSQHSGTIPKTGDYAPWVLVAVLALVGSIAIVASMLMHARNRKD